MLREVSHHRVLLSATPINLANEDLYHLLRLCDPDHFQYPSSFREMLAANRPLVLARDAALRRNSRSDEIIEHVKAAASSELLENSRQLASILEDPPTQERLQSAEYRAELASSLERVNLLGHVVTRTRKRDVQMERPRREVTPEKVPMTEAERKFYTYVTEVTRDYAWRRGISDGFLLATPQRQVCSCPAAFARAWLGGDSTLVDDMAELVLEDMEEGEDESELEDISATLKEFLLANRPRDVDAAELERSDSKFARLLDVLSDYFADNPGEKVILFSSFRATAHYLAERLSSAGMKSMLLWGNMRESKQDLINEFRDRPELRVLVKQLSIQVQPVVPAKHSLKAPLSKPQQPAQSSIKRPQPVPSVFRPLPKGAPTRQDLFRQPEGSSRTGCWVSKPMVLLAQLTNWPQSTQLQSSLELPVSLRLTS